jgi:hypothetical protein
MSAPRQTSWAGGIILILLGLFLFGIQAIPQWRDLFRGPAGWPLIVVGVGLFLFVFGLLVGAPGMAVPASIVGGIGGLLYWSNLTGAWESWAYLWALIPGLVGVGMVLMGLLGERPRESMEAGGWLILVSLMLFFIFASFLGGVNLLGAYWPVLVILLGVLTLLRRLFGFRRG